MSDLIQQRIYQLPIQLANQIAAGEVVERPASVVKELLENSLDAGATQIDIDIEQGGLRKIRIVDNGSGIHAEDLILALSRHATSKLLTLEDLSSIASLGFRGEALPSIASVSRFQLISHQAESQQAYSIEVNAQGEQSQLSPAAHPLGTSVIVEELFCNAPARRRFMRAAKTEFTHIQDVVQRVALGAPKVAINLHNNGRQVLRLSIADDETSYQRRLAKIFGQKFVASALPVMEESEEIRISGFVASADLHRSQSDHQYVYINGRVIRDRLVNHAIRQAYADSLPTGRYASYVLMIEIELNRVDVNVHPTKHEVRFRDSRLVHDFLFSAVNRALSQQVGSISADVISLATTEVHESATLYLASSNLQRAERSKKSKRLLFGEPLQLLHNRYLLCEEEKQLWLLDLRTLLTAVNKKRLSQSLNDGALKMRPLLLPQRLAFDAAVLEKLSLATQQATRLGFDVKQIDAGHVILRAAPMLLQTSASDVLLYSLLENLGESDESIVFKLAEAAAQATPLSTHTRALRDWLSIQFNLLGNISKRVTWARLLDANRLQTWFDET